MNGELEALLKNFAVGQLVKKWRGRAIVSLLAPSLLAISATFELTCSRKRAKPAVARRLGVLPVRSSWR